MLPPNTARSARALRKFEHAPAQRVKPALFRRKRQIATLSYSSGCRKMQFTLHFARPEDFSYRRCCGSSIRTGRELHERVDHIGHELTTAARPGACSPGGAGRNGQPLDDPRWPERCMRGHHGLPAYSLAEEPFASVRRRSLARGCSFFRLPREARDLLFALVTHAR